MPRVPPLPSSSRLTDSAKSSFGGLETKNADGTATCSPVQINRNPSIVFKPPRDLQVSPLGLFAASGGFEVPGIYNKDVFTRIDKLYDEIPFNTIDPRSLPVVDRYEQQRKKPMRALTHGRWWVFFLGDLKSYTIPGGTVINVPPDEELLEWVRLFDIAADSFMKHMKLTFLGSGPPKHKLYVYFTGTGTGGFPVALAGSNDSPWGVNTGIFDTGAILHEMGHACFPRLPDDPRLRHMVNGDFTRKVDFKEDPVYQSTNIGEALIANFFAWYCFHAMIQSEPRHPLLKDRLANCFHYQPVFFALRSQLAFDALHYVRPLWNPHIDGVNNGMPKKIGGEAFHWNFTMPLSDMMEQRYNSRYNTGYIMVYLYYKYGLKLIVALWYNAYRYNDMVETICYLLGDNTSPHDFMLEYAIDFVLQVYISGTSTSNEGKKAKYAYRYAKNMISEQEKKEHHKYAMEWKGFEVYDVKTLCKDAIKDYNSAITLYFEFSVNYYPCDWRFAFVQGWPVGFVNEANIVDYFTDVTIIRQKGASTKQQLKATLNGKAPAYIIIVAGGVRRPAYSPGYKMTVRLSQDGPVIATVNVAEGKRPEDEIRGELMKSPKIPIEPDSCSGSTLTSQLSPTCMRELWSQYGCENSFPEEYKNMNKKDFMKKVADTIVKDSGKCFAQADPCANFNKDTIPSNSCIRWLWHNAGCKRPIPYSMYYNEQGPGLKQYTGMSRGMIEYELDLWVNIRANITNSFHADNLDPTRNAACNIDPNKVV